MIYDVIITGAGIAGLNAAVKLSRNGMKVCVVDRRSTIGWPVRCGEATGTVKELSRFIEIDSSCIARQIDALEIQINGAPMFKREIPEAGVILNRDKLEQKMADIACSQGALLLLNKLVTGLSEGQNGWDGVILEHGKKLEGRFIIGADGPESKIGQWAGITRPLTLDEAGSAVEYTLNTDAYDDHCLHFFTGSREIPSGYIWVFPKGNGRILVGGILYGCSRSCRKVQHYVDAFIEKKFPNVKKHSMITGCAPITVSPKVLHRSNVLVAGDAGRMVNPLSSAGIMNAFESSDLAADCILCAAEGDQTLGRYTDRWRKQQRFQQKIFLLLKEIFLNSSDTELESILKNGSLFFANVNRDKPFRFPLIPTSVFVMQTLPRIIRYRSALFM